MNSTQSAFNRSRTSGGKYRIAGVLVTASSFCCPKNWASFRRLGRFFMALGGYTLRFGADRCAIGSRAGFKFEFSSSCRFAAAVAVSKIARVKPCS